MPVFERADRIRALPPYLFAQIDKVKDEVKARGVDIISLGIGDPDMPTPEFIIDALCQSARKPANHQYPSYIGMLSYRQAVADWYKQRFEVELDAKSEVVTLIGSKEGIAHFPIAYVNPGDLVLICTPNYPVYDIATSFMGGEIQHLPLLEENDYLPDLDAVPAETWQRAKMLFLNYPNNPTSATAPDSFYEKLIAIAQEHNVILVHDAAYTEIYFDPANKPKSILQFPGAKDVAIEFHSLSKTYNMTGWRIGMAVGNADIVGGLGKVKENVDSGAFQAVQEAAIVALQKGEPFAEQFRAVYKERRDVVVKALRDVGIDCRSPEAAFYIWSKIPKGYGSSAEFVTKVIQETGVVLTPGNGFGTPGEGYFRISLTLDSERLKEAVSRISSKL